MDMEIAPLSAPLGARVTGVDLSRPLDPDTLSAIHAAWLEHLVLVFPDQDLSDADQIRFTGHFGALGARKGRDERSEGEDVHQGVMLVSNIREDGEPIGSLPDGEMMFHSDGAYTTRPYKATVLFAIELPETGGDTLFANLYRAYETLPAALKDRIDGLDACHQYYSGTTMKEQPVGSLSGAITVPVVKIHDETGRRALFVSRLLTERIEGAGADAALLDLLLDHSENPDCVYAHQWRKGDLVIWDNRCTNHARTDFSPLERRLLRRTTALTDGVGEEVEA